jgi:hypothetical protein
VGGGTAGPVQLEASFTHVEHRSRPSQAPRVAASSESPSFVALNKSSSEKASIEMKIDMVKPMPARQAAGYLG